MGPALLLDSDEQTFERRLHRRRALHFEEAVGATELQEADRGDPMLSLVVGPVEVPADDLGDAGRR